MKHVNLKLSRRFFLGSVLAVGLVAFQFAGVMPAQASAENPRAVVESFHTVLLDVMKQSKVLNVKARFDRLLPAIQQAFNLPLMVKAASGNGWKLASEPEKAEMVAAFTRMSAGTYASRFSGYSGQEFKTVGERPGPRDMILVETEIASPDGSSVTLTYLTRKAEDGWRIVDVLLDGGISELAVRRSEYRRIVKTGGAGGLTSILNQTAEKLLQTP
ncbi:MAG: ABC transporter substrate-binding protein [Proteobacteria bacterium]|nr:ABC transporter substrate-binding protein [Pseudomonadota bacterium]